MNDYRVTGEKIIEHAVIESVYQSDNQTLADRRRWSRFNRGSQRELSPARRCVAIRIIPPVDGRRELDLPIHSGQAVNHFADLY